MMINGEGGEENFIEGISLIDKVAKSGCEETKVYMGKMQNFAKR